MEVESAALPSHGKHMGNKRTSSSWPSREAASLYSMPEQELDSTANDAVQVAATELAGLALSRPCQQAAGMKSRGGGKIVRAAGCGLQPEGGLRAGDGAAEHEGVARHIT